MTMQRMFNLVCDGVDVKGYSCNEIYDGSEWYADEARKVAYADGWKRVRGKDYCPSCVERQVWRTLTR